MGLLLAVGLMVILVACSPGVPRGDVPGAGRSEAGRRYLALGDSYTFGEGLQADSRWPVLLTSAMEEAGCGEFELTLVARTGWTAGELLSEMLRQQMHGPFDLISLQVGVNDQYRGRAVEEFHQDLIRLLDEVGRLAGGKSERVLVISIPDWSASPFGVATAGEGTAAEIDAFNAELSRAAGEYGFQFVDVTDLTRAGSLGSDSFTPDGLHYSRAMNERWLQRVLPGACAVGRGG